MHWLTVTVSILVGAIALHGAVQLGRKRELWERSLRVLRAARWWMLPAAAMNIVVFGAVAAAIRYSAPFTWIGWWQLLGGVGNVWLAHTDSPSLAAHVLTGVVLGCLSVSLPMLAYSEEVSFRRGSERLTIGARVRRQTWFGLMHCVFAGVPITLGLALIPAGFYFERVYLAAVRRGAADPVAVSAAAHAISNAVAIAMTAGYLVFH